MRKLILSAVKREKSQPLRNCVRSDPPLPSEFPCPPWGGGGGGGGGRSFLAMLATSIKPAEFNKIFHHTRSTRIRKDFSK